jgi:hypothetical protein
VEVIEGRECTIVMVMGLMSMWLQSIPIQYLRTTVRCMTEVLADAPWALLSQNSGDCCRCIKLEVFPS